MPALTKVSAAEEPAGPDPTTATRSTKYLLPHREKLRVNRITAFQAFRPALGGCNPIATLIHIETSRLGRDLCPS